MRIQLLLGSALFCLLACASDDERARENPGADAGGAGGAVDAAGAGATAGVSGNGGSQSVGGSGGSSTCNSSAHTCRYVAKSGNDTGDCSSPDSPCLTITYGVSRL